MHKQIELVLSPEEAAGGTAQKEQAAQLLGIPVTSITFVKLLRRSIDARSSLPRIRLLAEIFYDEPPPETFHPKTNYPNVSEKTPVIIVGAGPGGLFAALRFIELGYKPVIIERGKDVRSRRHDLAAINKKHFVNPDSNYCFGEGGAGTYSDGKLYTRATKRGDVSRILNTLVSHGAQEEILIDAHPHIGTNKLPKLIQNIRQSILNSGGEIHFNTRLEELLIRDSRVHGILVKSSEDKTETPGTRIEASAVILATGHSARDIFEMLHRKNILLEAKPFALGVRIEHPQELIDSIQYHCPSRGPYLPAASYRLAHEVNGRGVYSFCMCPGGFIVPAATAPGEIVVNGMSPSKRDSKFANSGIVVGVTERDLVSIKQKTSNNQPLSLLRFQQSIEQSAWQAGGKTQSAPAQRMTDFVKNHLSSTLPETSYQPGTVSAPLNEIFPAFITSALQESMKVFGKKMKGYFTEEALLLGVESRTSSPVRIPRDPVTLQHVQIGGLFPCGEGAGYAGGIVSAAMDGEKCAEQCGEYLKK